MSDVNKTSLNSPNFSRVGGVHIFDILRKYKHRWNDKKEIEKKIVSGEYQSCKEIPSRPSSTYLDMNLF